MNDKRKTWFIDFDGTLVSQESHLSDCDYILPSTLDFFEKIVKEEDYVIITTARSGEKHKDRIESFMKSYNLKFDLIVCDIPSGSRILINDRKPDGSLTAFSVNLNRDQGINLEQMWDIYDNQI